MSDQQTHPHIEILRAALKAAVQTFNESTDRDHLLCPRSEDAKPKSPEWAAASERSIAHRLAFYLECELRRIGVVAKDKEIVVDCEYNRHLGALKAMKAKHELAEIVKEAGRKPIPLSDDDGWFVFSVAPDIVVHKRRSDESNLLVLEVKKASNTESPEYDDLKLTLFTKRGDAGYGYALGVSIIARDNIEPAKRVLEIGKEYPSA